MPDVPENDQKKLSEQVAPGSGVIPVQAELVHHVAGITGSLVAGQFPVIGPVRQRNVIHVALA